jgi:hypothetical protein
MKLHIFFVAIVLAATSVVTYSQTATVKAIQANVRERPSNTAAILFKVRQNAKLKVESLEHTNGWYYITKGSQKGWIYGDAIELADNTIGKGKNEYSVAKANKWVYYASSDEGKYYYNAGTMTRSGSIRRVWAKMVYLGTYDTGSMVQYDVKCGGGQYRTLAGVTYYKSGSVKQSFDRPSSYYSTAIPETIMDALVKAICD